MMRAGKVLQILVCLIAVGLPPEAVAKDENLQADYFERNVRPVLVSRCLECHEPDTQESGLRVDSLERMLAGGDGEPAIVPGSVLDSRLIHAIRRQGDLKMPPDIALPPQEIASLERWVQMGAFWPENETLSVRRIEAADHWAFQPIQDPPAPLTRDSDWSRTSVDPFVLARRESEGLAPSPAADRRTLLRRLSLPLHGLPPTYEDVRQFVHDAAPDAWARLVDRLLSSPRYGEHWGRHWLDVARYAETKGFAYFEDLNYPYAWSYRDYVINALNEDVPYDDFVTQQLAADHLPPDEFRRTSAALGFLTLASVSRTTCTTSLMIGSTSSHEVCWG